MRLHEGLPKSFWAKVVHVVTVSYLINCRLCIPLDFGLLEEIWSRKQVDLAHLRIFESLTYVHINVSCKGKLDAKFKHISLWVIEAI